jgi:hypothetical protein
VVLFARSATAGGQQFPMHWGVACWSSFGVMAESLRGGLSLSLSGFGFWSHDIGGFEGIPDPAVFKRWMPWEFGDKAVEVARQFTELKHRLMPYLYGAATEAHRAGIPVLRPMLLKSPATRQVAPWTGSTCSGWTSARSGRKASAGRRQGCCAVHTSEAAALPFADEASGAQGSDVHEVSTRERLACKPAFDLASLEGSGLYLSASALPCFRQRSRGAGTGWGS